MWEEKANKDKERYADEMKVFKANGGGTEAGTSNGGSSPLKRKKDADKSSGSATMTGQGFKSKEYISDDDASSDDGSSSAKKAKPKAADPESKSESKDADDDDDEVDDDDVEEDEDDEDASEADDSD